MDNMNNIIDNVAQEAQQAGLQTTIMEPINEAKKGVSKIAVGIASAVGGTALGYGIARGVDAVRAKHNENELDKLIKQRDELNKMIEERQKPVMEAEFMEVEFMEVDGPAE